MATNLSYSRYIPTYVGQPVEEIGSLGETLQNRYYQNVQASEQLETIGNAVKVRDVNKPILQEALQGLRGAFEPYKNKGNWEDAEMTVRSAARNFANNEQLKAATEDYGKFQAWKTELDERFKEGEINVDQKNWALAQAAQKNNAPVEVDPVTGEYQNVWSARTPSKDMSKEIQDYTTEIAKMYKASTVDNPIAVQVTDKNGNKVQKYVAYGTSKTGTPPGYFDVQTKEYLDKNTVKAAMARSILSNPSYRAYLEEASEIDVWKKTQAKGGPISILDVYNPTNSYNSILNKQEFEQLSESFEEQGTDMEKIAEDPLMIEALYRRLNMNKRVNDMIEAPSEAVSYEKIEHKFLNDIQFAEMLKFRNDMAKIRAKGAEDRKTARAKEDYKKQTMSEFVIKNTGPIIDNAGYDLESNSKALQERKKELARLDNELKANGEGMSPNSYSKLKEKRDVLARQVAIQENQIGSAVKFFYETDEGKDYIQKAYDEFKKFGAQAFMSEGMEEWRDIDNIEEFKAKLLKKKDKPKKNFLERLFGNVSMGDAAANPLVRYQDASALSTYLNDVNKRILKKTQTKVDKAEEEFPGLTGSTFDMPDMGQKSGVYRKINETKTNYYLGNKTGYYALSKKGDNITAADWEQAARERIKKEHGIEDANLKAIVTSSDADHSVNGVALFPDKVALVDNKGRTFAETWVYPVDGGADERYQVGMYGRNEFPKGSAEYEDATRMAATAKFSHIIPEDLNRESSYITADSRSIYRSEPFDKVHHNFGDKVRFFKRAVPVKNEDGLVEGREIIWEVGLLDEKGVVKAYAPNTQFMDETPEGLKFKEEVKDKLGRFQFKSVNDARVALFRLTVGQK
jgi:hypothetical protein